MLLGITNAPTASLSSSIITDSYCLGNRIGATTKTKEGVDDGEEGYDIIKRCDGAVLYHLRFCVLSGINILLLTPGLISTPIFTLFYTPVHSRHNCKNILVLGLVFIVCLVATIGVMLGDGLAVCHKTGF